MQQTSPHRELSGRVAVVTASSKPIGRAIALDLAAAGARVVAVARRRLDEAEATAAGVRALGQDAMATLADVTDEGSVEAMMTAAVDRFGHIDILVNNAGLDAPAPLISLTAADWDSVFAVNAKGAFLCGAAAARRMLPRNTGAIVNITGASAHRCWPGRGAYAPAKAAVVNLTQQMALEWAEGGLRVNGVSPGPIFAPGSDWQVSDPTLVARFGKLPLKRPGVPQEVASAVTYLVSDRASYITGQTLLVDGGGAATWYITA